MTQSSSRREFIKQVGAGAAVLGAGLGPTPAEARPHTFATGRVRGANDRLNVGFVGCGGRMNTHIRHVVARSTAKGDVMAVAVNDIWDKRKKAAQEATGVDAKSVYHDYRELCERSDIDIVVISSPDHWHHAHALAALKAGKDVYLEKPMT